MYKPRPINTDDVELSDELIDLKEELAKNAHEVWAQQRINDGWTYGEKRDDFKKQTPLLVPYFELPEEEKEYDRNVAMETLKVVVMSGYDIKKLYLID